MQDASHDPAKPISLRKKERAQGSSLFGVIWKFFSRRFPGEDGNHLDDAITSLNSCAGLLPQSSCSRHLGAAGKVHRGLEQYPFERVLEQDEFDGAFVPGHPVRCAL